MSASRRPERIVLVVVSGFVFGTANAQSDVAKTEAELAKPMVEDVSDAEKATRARSAVARMSEILSKVLKYLADARDERDVIKLNCINEKLSSIKGLLKISEQASVLLQESIVKGDGDVAQHEFEKISLALSKCEQLYSDSESCVGELAVYAGETRVEMVTEGVSKEDPNQLFLAWGSCASFDGKPNECASAGCVYYESARLCAPMHEEVSRPGAASPFQ